MAHTSPFQISVAELLIGLSLFVNKIDPNPFVAVAAIDIFKENISNQYIFKTEVDVTLVKITSVDVRELYDQLWTFFKELELYNHPDVAIAALELTKHQFIKEIERPSTMILKE